jgi:cyclopropane fatty-acyl-phospholipid synthase-like methyltransferase
LIELGGANSCFYDAIQDQVRPRSYSILDNNPLGLQKFRERIASCTGRILEADVLGYQGSPEFDAVFSVGLIEHFSPEDTRRSVLTHWHLVRPGGVMILFFPTPTWLYRITRWFSEALGLWIFHDERPLRPSEVSGALPADAELVHQSTIWPIFLTQSILVARKTPCP